MKKSLIISTIASIGVSALVGILALFGAFKFEGFVLKMFFTFLTLSLGSLLALNSVNLLETKKILLPLISLTLLGISTLMAIIFYWTDMKWGAYVQILLTIAIFSVLFNIIISNVMKLNNKYLAFQIATYAFIAIFDIFLVLQIWGLDVLEDLLKIFILDIILMVVGLIILAVLGKKGKIKTSNIETSQSKIVLENIVPAQIKTEVIDNVEYVKITKTDYDAMIEKIKDLI